MIIYVIGIVWGLFGISEVNVQHSTEIKKERDHTETGTESKNGIENPAFITDQNTKNQLPSNNNLPQTNGEVIEQELNVSKGNFFIEFFDPTLALACIAVFRRQRKNNGRFILFLLFGVYFIAILPGKGEPPHMYTLQRRILDWEAVEKSDFETYKTVTSLLGK